jgi:hypothetical protein
MSDNSCPASANHRHCFHIEYADVSGRRMTDMERCCFCGLQRQRWSDGEFREGVEWFSPEDVACTGPWGDADA